ncbi:unnamed protein product [Rotaria magnacalcarata]
MKKHQPKNKDELKRYLLHERAGIGRDVTEKLILFYFTMSNLSLHDENDSNPSTIKQYSKYRAMFDYSLSTRWYRITTGPYSKQVDKKHKLLKHPFLIQWNPMDRIEHRRNHSTIDSNPKRRKTDD